MHNWGLWGPRGPAPICFSSFFHAPLKTMYPLPCIQSHSPEAGAPGLLYHPDARQLALYAAWLGSHLVAQGVASCDWTAHPEGSSPSCWNRQASTEHSPDPTASPAEPAPVSLPFPDSSGPEETLTSPWPLSHHCAPHSPPNRAEVTRGQARTPPNTCRLEP